MSDEIKTTISQEETDKTAEQTEKELEQAEKDVEESEKLSKKIKRSEKSVKRYQFFVLRVLIFLIVLWVLLFKIIGITTAPNGDMYPRIDAGDLILYYRLDTDVKSQDVIVIEKVTPESEGKKLLYLGRVVAVEGDTVEITDSGHLIVNGNSLVESNIFYSTPPYEGFVEYPLTLGPGQCFILSDSRQGGADSRFYGPVEKKEIVGTVITIARRNNL